MSNSEPPTQAPQSPKAPRSKNSSSPSVVKNAQRQRENNDPDEGIRPLPWFLVMFLGAMAMWGAFYIYITPSGEATAYGDQRSVATLRPAVAQVAGGGGAGAAKADGKQIYAAKCVACHQPTGAGLAGVFPPLAASEWVLGEDKTLINILLHGVNGEMVVKGNTYNGAMPAWNAMSDDELAAVMSYIRSDWGNQGAPITAKAVQAQREGTKAQTAPYAGGAALKAAL
ncbi:MAG: cytochrome c [Pseudorhodobacter sp.]|nr:cytochrome c [Rhizobacter sp.]